ncbi:MAG: hypothetical protein M3501_10675 [Actinomycetota bacterium]|nr:hypothetical protein [Actinomycetota bacterium]MDQ3405625.1 hypothetical protein [Actinomycetota bacterium]
MPRRLTEAVIASDRLAPGERRALYVTLMAARRVLAGAADNLNQLTRWSHSREMLHPEIDTAIATVEEAARGLRSLWRTSARAATRQLGRPRDRQDHPR